jgi:iron-sulfur cluster repair protein YtfE (RIC family)
MSENFDHREMEVLHSVYRREFGLAGDLIRRVEVGDTSRAALVNGHLTLIEEALAEHHHAEDNIVWPLLLERKPDVLAPIVTRMEVQHKRVSTALEEIQAQRQRWVVTTSKLAGDNLAEQYARFYTTLVEHLDDEESNVMPLAARHLTSAEWRRRARYSSGRKRPSDVVLLFGMMIYGGDPEVVAGMVPRLARILLGGIGLRMFRKHSLAIHGTRTP